MNDDELVETFPELFHMAAEGAWPSIRANGLLPTRELVGRCDPEPDVRASILGRRRTESITLRHPERGEIVIRDQGPLREHILARCLTDMTAAQWLDVLNDRVFFWPRRTKLEGLLGARLYRHRAHDVLVVDTESLVAAHRERIRLSDINSGATQFPNAPARGSDTFRTIEAFPWPHPTRRPIIEGLTELAVVGGVPDIAAHVVRVERRHGDELVEQVYVAPGRG